MTESDQSSVAASGPHRQSGENSNAKADTRPLSIWGRLRSMLGSRPASTVRDDLAEVLEDQGRMLPGNISANERAMLQNVLKLHEMRVDDVMVPRADIDAVDTSDTMADLILAFRTAGHSRLPVYDDNLDHIVGFVHIKDAMERLTLVPAPNGAPDAQPVKLQTAVLRQKIGAREMVRKVTFVPPSMPVAELLQQMQATRIHMAIVVDEYGGTDGLVTIEDLLEAVVGDIEDEHDESDGPLVREVEEGIWIADARAELSELQALIGEDFDPGVHAEDVDTLGGLLFELIDRVPVRGELVTRMKGFEFEIISADARRIRRVRIVRRKRAARGRTPAKPDNTSRGAE